MNRRHFLTTAAAGVTGLLAVEPVDASAEGAAKTGGVGMLMDTTECIGCRKCEFACAQQNALSDAPVEAFEDTKVFDEARRPNADAFTVVNRFANPADPESPIHVKTQCMHCLEPACASACLVGALKREDNGVVAYDPWKCMGCRYCMVACPFQIPAYEYDDALTPRVRKCGLCMERVVEGETPACAEMCPPMAITFGTREELLEIAREKIAAAPERYSEHIYGEHEVGGTSWLYLLPGSQGMKELGFLELGEEPIPNLTETIQHGVFRFGLLPAFLFGMLGAVMKVTKEDEKSADSVEEKK